MVVRYSTILHDAQAQGNTMSRGDQWDNRIGMGIIPPKRKARISAKARRVAGSVQAHKRTSNKAITPPLQMDVHGVIRTAIPQIPYIPKDPGRAERLIAANRKINEERAQAQSNSSRNCSSSSSDGIRHRISSLNQWAVD